MGLKIVLIALVILPSLLVVIAAQPAPTVGPPTPSPFDEHCTIPDFSGPGFLLEITESTTLCPGDYSMPPTKGFKMACNDCFLDCRLSKIASLDIFQVDNVEVRNCNTYTFVLDSNNSLIKNFSYFHPEFGGAFTTLDVANSHNTTIVYNNFTRGETDGLFANTYGIIVKTDSTNTTIINNTISGFKYCITPRWNSTNDTIMNNTVFNCEHGIKPYTGSANQTVKENIVYDGHHDGIYISELSLGTYVQGINSHVVENIVYDSENCIRVETDVITDLIVHGNDVSNCDEGISTEQTFGVAPLSAPTIRYNDISNSLTGIYIQSYVTLGGGSIQYNNFLSNTLQAQDDGSGIAWNAFDKGNYWDDFDEIVEGCLDGNGDGKCDGPYIIPGTAGSMDNLPSTTPF